MIAMNASQSAYAVVYDRDGPATSAAVARGESKLLGVAIAAPGEDPVYLTHGDAAQALAAISGTPWIYEDALLARTIERQCNLPAPRDFQCLRIARHLLGRGNASERPPGSAQESLTRAGDLLVEYESAASALATERLIGVYRDVELPAIDPTTAMILQGVLIDRDQLEVFHAQSQHMLHSAQCNLARIAGRRINPQSYQEVAGYLFDELQLPVESWTAKGNPAVDVATLERLEEHHPAVAPLLGHAQARQVHTRAKELLRAIAPCTGRIHSHLDPLGTVTGRFSSSRPALQNLPQEIRSAIVAPPGHVLVEADYSQIELRVLAALSGEPKLVEAFNDPATDLHRKTAAAIFGVDEAAVLDDQRRVGKQVNFAVIYGETEYGLADDLGIRPEQARRFIHGYFESHPRVAQWVKQVHELAHRCGEVRTVYGRRRLLPEIRGGNHAVAAAERRAVNTAVQGTAADILKLSLARLHAALPADVRMVLTVHDSVLLEVPADRVDEVGQHVRATMETPPPGFAVPLRVDVSTGRTWAECKCRSQTREHVAV